MWLQPACAVLFTLGYSLRLYGAYNYLYTENFTRNLIVYIMSQVFIYTPPPLLELSNYHILGRTLHYIPYLSPLPPTRVLSTFGALLALVEALNGLGVALAANPSSSSSQQHLGGTLIIAAIALQIGALLAFCVLAGWFQRRCVRAGLWRVEQARPVRVALGALYGSTALLFVRGVYRLVEHLGDTAKDLGDVESLRRLSPILRYEWFLYVFEATVMLLNSGLWNVWNPGRYLPVDVHVYLARDGNVVVGSKGKQDERTWWMKGASVLTFGVLYRHKAGPVGWEELGALRRGEEDTECGSGDHQRLVRSPN
ncbi:uncharacterized protein HMPREF1541_10186 [Cyphellophora europaea CBS 101466]|uniref:RTA1 domain-containing protein n=1 Tax=Cyphellophora europaea (strain CBS 101466) TaxID=1220924 RepID=W2S733_CYPE1|nr:uncharacterized protein HMPREF1541_10186 [Cyphellophora europaea CBS 101466]ETN44516.1 hypothetical protein HMPREF1541_10186 [Cyphellophora europaea CBS 101466]